jgi:predicted amidophosphoribosyltransferase
MDERLEQVPGFGRCGLCLYNTSGPAELCFACARRTMEPLAPRRCLVCDRPYAAGENICGNPLCNRSDRWFQWNFAISMRTGTLKDVINRYKYEGQWTWAYIFGRVVAGFLEEQAVLFREFDVITASPTYVGPDGRGYDHTRMVLARAAAEVSPGSLRPFDITGEALVVKTVPTPRMVGHTYRERRDIAEGPLRAALRVTRDVRGKRVLVYDDVFTDGLTLNEVARALRRAGATEVCGVALCRQPYRGQALASFAETTTSLTLRRPIPGSGDGMHISASSLLMSARAARVNPNADDAPRRASRTRQSRPATSHGSRPRCHHAPLSRGTQEPARLALDHDVPRWALPASKRIVARTR